MFPERLKELRKQEPGLTQEKLASQLGMAKTTLASYEQGKRQPDLKTLTKIADRFSVTADYLLGKDQTPAWVTKEDTKDLKEFLESNEGSMTFGGVDLTPEQDAQVRVAMATIFWNEKKKEKK
ncbi:helix-turn-helix domain-containing protein [Levilactobacillus tujiorum]|uniref:helix-turn-helix domain-containing protein n=1 Tax=Levilactobacillus tujiorum TaxID=2912243 RepID=UPI0014571E88|nr:helix-turn-helix transcriptional regulator [Levilactobacillus tujiorum]NLR32244.1 helix-turn-helix transcriptional regulator [Levilactobacillus tujiorum]